MIGGAFSEMTSALSLSLLRPRLNYSEDDLKVALETGLPDLLNSLNAITASDMKRLKVILFYSLLKLIRHM